MKLHTKILLGLAVGLAYGLLSIQFGWPAEFTINWIKPIGTIFIRALKMIAVPLVLASLIIGVANIGDISKLSRMGGKTLFIFLVLTLLSTTLGLALVNVFKPGTVLSAETREMLMSEYQGSVGDKLSAAESVKSTTPLQPIVDMVPENVIAAAADNSGMLQVVFFAIIVGIALLQIPKEKGEPVVRFFDGFNDIIIKIVEYIMKVAPYGVFALIASLIVETKSMDLLLALLGYSATVVAGLLLMLFLVYPLLVKWFSRISIRQFFKGMRPAMLLGFSTSSSSATLPVTMERVQKHMGVSEEVSSFVLPLGATINMNGTSLYQAVAAVFIAQAVGLDLSIMDQIMIVITATLAAVGSAGVPGAGMVMLVIVLEAAGIPAAGLALIMAPDRILDMIRTTVNLTGDAATAVVIATGENAIQVDDAKLE